MTLEETLRAIIREEIRAALDARLPKTETTEILFERIDAFAKRIGVSRRHIFDLRDRGALATVGQGRALRVDVPRSLEMLRAHASEVDDAIEKSARASARKAARKAST